MKSTFLLSCFVLCSILRGAVTEDPDPRDKGCWAMDRFYAPPQMVIHCANMGIDGGSFEEVIGDGSILSYEYAPNSVNGTFVPFKESIRNVSASEIADLVTKIDLTDSHNVTMSENALHRFVNLSVLQIYAPMVGDGERGRLNLAPGVFRQSSQLTELEICRMSISDESIPALLELKDRLEAITIADVSPEDKVFSALGQFTKLKYMGFFNCSARSFPVDVIKRSAASLETFEIQNCNFPKLAKDLFAKSPKLGSIRILRSNLAEVEPGAFDQNPLLHSVNIGENNLSSFLVGPAVKKS